MDTGEPKQEQPTPEEPVATEGALTEVVRKEKASELYNAFNELLGEGRSRRDIHSEPQYETDAGVYWNNTYEISRFDPNPPEKSLHPVINVHSRTTNPWSLGYSESLYVSVHPGEESITHITTLRDYSENGEKKYKEVREENNEAAVQKADRLLSSIRYEVKPPRVPDTIPQ